MYQWTEYKWVLFCSVFTYTLLPGLTIYQKDVWGDQWQTQDSLFMLQHLQLYCFKKIHGSVNNLSCTNFNKLKTIIQIKPYETGIAAYTYHNVFKEYQAKNVKKIGIDWKYEGRSQYNPFHKVKAEKRMEIRISSSSPWVIKVSFWVFLSVTADTDLRHRHLTRQQWDLNWSSVFNILWIVLGVISSNDNESLIGFQREANLVSISITKTKVNNSN